MTRPAGYNPDETVTDDGLPRERLRDVRWRSVAIEWAVAVAVVALINVAAIAALDRVDPNRFRVQVEVKYERLREHGGDYDSLILGDSTPNQGIKPELLNEQLGGKWMNLATVANMLALSDAWLLDEYIDTHGVPERVIVCHVPDMWAREADPGVMSQAPVGVNDFGGLNPPIDWSAKDKLVVLGTRYFPLYSKQQSLLELVQKPWKARDLRETFGGDGFMQVQGQVDGWPKAVEAAIAEREQTPYKLSEDNARAMRRLIELAEQHGFMIYLTPGSVSQPLAASEGYRRNFDAMIEQYQKWAASSEHVTLILPEPQAFAREMMFDEDHVNAEGAVAWTTRIAEAVKRVEQNKGEGDAASNGGDDE
ncbi:MAG: hypothetical protein ACE37H_02150 [Phycisphaeraceae bacterium]